MTNCEPDCKPTSRYSANEAAALLGIHRNSLRKYTDEEKAEDVHYTLQQKR